jgi:hypothetical protein
MIFADFHHQSIPLEPVIGKCRLGEKSQLPSFEILLGETAIGIISPFGTAISSLSARDRRSNHLNSLPFRGVPPTQKRPIGVRIDLVRHKGPN